MSEADAEYAVKIMNQIKLYGKPIRVNKASYDKKQVDVGANLFVGNLDPNVDEQTLYDTFSTFGTLADQPKVGSLVFFFHVKPAKLTYMPDRARPYDRSVQRSCFHCLQ